MRFRPDHKFIQNNLSAYLDQRLTPRQKERVERHLAECPACRQKLATLRSTVALLRQTPTIPVPRSFVLPASVQVEQTRHRRWSMAYGMLRSAAIVISFALVLFLSSDAMITMGLLPMVDQTAPREEKVMIASTVQPTRVPNIVVERAVIVSPTTESDGQSGGAPAPSPAALKEKEVARAVAAPKGGAESTEPAGEAEAPKAARLSVAKQVSTPSAAGGDAQAQTEVLESSSEQAKAPQTATAQKGTQVTPTMTPTAAISESSTATPTATPYLLHGESSKSTLSSLWQLFRTIWVTLSGLLLVLFGALIWAGHKRRI